MKYTALVLLSFGCAFARQPEPIRYTLRFPAPYTHYVEVEASFPTGGKPAVDLMMAVWTPGSYLVREFERHVEELRAAIPGGQPLAIEKTRKNEWRVETHGARHIRVDYKIYAREMIVQGIWVESSFAMLNGAPAYITLKENVRRPHDVTLVLPPAWKTTMTSLPAAPDGAPHHYLAPDYDTLVDSPIVAGNPAVYEFEVAGKKHYLLNTGEAGVWDGPRSARDVEKIVREFYRMWGFLPYEKYVFFNMLTGGGGGLEHKGSTMIMASRWASRNLQPEPEPASPGQTGRRRPSYPGWLGTVSHEYFHAWNVKRLRPVELGPFEYEDEDYTRSLWIAEGVTSYYGPLALRRAGLVSRDDYLRNLSRTIEQLQTTPGRLVTPVEQASFDAWIKQYRPDENSVNATISYYTKGAVLGFLLDAKVRHATNGAKGLDDVMKLEYARYAGSHGYTPAEFRRTAQEVAGVDLSGWFEKVLDTTAELDYSEALDWFGLRFRPAAESRTPARPWTGLNTNPNLVVTEVRRGTPAYDSGISAGDEIVGINDFRVTPATYRERLESYQPGETVSLLVARREELMRFDVKLGSMPAPPWRLEVRPDATEAQQAHRKAWLMEQ